MHKFTRSLLALGCAATCLGAAVPASARQGDITEPYRPGYHFTPDRNWMNDPNGLVFHKGTYHLFFQHNPFGNSWGNMSWGHATSTDLVNWKQQPVAIQQTKNADGVSTEDIFSGSVVVDKTNSTGFGTRKNPPLVAIYTSAYTAADSERPNTQAQSLAYSLDDGRTWTKYQGNPVLEAGADDFRDPKVFRYDGPAGSYWVMAVVRANKHIVQLYRSDDLRTWSHLSDFGPANAVGGQWECPDLFPMKVKGTNQTKWVMLVNINPGGVNGGSAGQYFVGDFDGRTFTANNVVKDVPSPTGNMLADFEGDLDGWIPANEPVAAEDGPWGTAPVAGSIGGQQTVTGFEGRGYVNGFHGGDGPTGTLTSPEFTVDTSHLNFLIGGGNHPRVERTQLENTPPAGSLLFDGFEYAGTSSLSDHGWTLSGDLVAGRNPSTNGGSNVIGNGRINTWEGGAKGDDNVGDLTSPEFTIDQDWISFLVGGGRRDDGSLAVELLVDGTVVRTSTGKDDGTLNWQSWKVDDLRGRTAQLRVHDAATGGWGHLTLDHVVMGPEKAQQVSNEVSANLVVDGRAVRSATGKDSESLDWQSWDVTDLAGKKARVQLVDNNRDGWGHLLFDSLMASDAPARSRLTAYDWLDWGRDDYATVTFSNVPGNKVVSLGWMNNWDYAGVSPTPTWRSANTLPRELSLVQTAQGPKLSSQPVKQLRTLQGRPVLKNARITVDGRKVLPATGDMVRVDATIEPGKASAAGIDVLASGSERTRIGYDKATGEMYVDRTRSGRTDFSSRFASVDRAPVQLRKGKLELTIYVDRSSVEVFAQDGTRTITDTVYPSAGSDDIAVWSEGGTAKVSKLTVTPMKPMDSRRPS